jgi:hypothetical protein
MVAGASFTGRKVISIGDQRAGKPRLSTPLPLLAML